MESLACSLRSFYDEMMERLWHGEPPDRIVIASLERKTGEFKVVDVEDAVDLETHEIFYSLGAVDGRRVYNGRRGSEADVVALPALHLDVDLYKQPGDYKENNTKMNKLLHANAPPYSLKLMTGKESRHIYWVFDEPLMISNDQERKQAKRLLESWFLFWSDAFADIGWSLDKTVDLARMLRLPGTYNLKAGKKRKRLCRVTADNGCRYSVDDLIYKVGRENDFTSAPGKLRGIIDSTEVLELKVSKRSYVPQPSVVDGLRLGLKAPAKLMKVLSEPDIRFFWDGGYSDPNSNWKNKTASAGTWGLMASLVKRLWKDQEIISSAEAFRKHIKAENAKSLDWYVATLRSAKRKVDRDFKKLGFTDSAPLTSGDWVAKVEGVG